MKPTTTAFDTICRELDAHPLVSEWVAREVRRYDTQLYLIGAEPEAARQVNTVGYEATIYGDHSGGRGEASFSLGPGDLPRLRARLDEAAFMASLSANRAFELPPPAASYPQIPLQDPALETPAAATAEAKRLRQVVTGALAEEAGVRLSSLELFLSTTETFLRAGNGCALFYPRSKATLELVLTSFDDEGREAEAFKLLRRRRVSDLDAVALVRRQALYARDSLRAKPPRSGAAPVAIEAEELLPFLAPVQTRASAATKYRGATPWEVGQPIAPGQRRGSGYDALTLLSDATLPYGLESRPIDDETLPGGRFTLIREGVLERYWATARYAHYMDLEPTGSPANMILRRGSNRSEDLLVPEGDEPLYHVVAFSWLTPDRLTGDFSAEIRLGYEITRSGTTPIRGGAISGNVFTGLAHARFSRETGFLGSYQGPLLARFDTFTVAGA